jgi:pimeloyl-ACP methyl ester carboxylesterase
MPFVPANGTRIFYEETGTPGGRPLLLLHAALQTGESMEPLRKRPELQGFRIVAPDLRGHGQTANPSRTLSIAQLANDMETFIGHLGLDRPLMVGYSLGGITAIELGRCGRLSGLAVLASRIHTAPRGRKAFDPEDIRRRSPRWAVQLAQKHVETPWEQLATELGDLFETWPGFTSAELRAVACPTLVVQGDRDHMVPLEEGQELAATVPGAHFRLVPRAAHPELLYRHEALSAVVEFSCSL